MLGVFGAIRQVVPFRPLEIVRVGVRGDPFSQRGPVAKRAVHDVTVAAFADLEVAAPMERAAAWFDAALTEVAARNVLDRARGRLLHTEVDPLPRAVAVAREERTHRRDRAVVSRRMIRLEPERTHRLAARVAAYVEHPAQRGE